MKHLKLYEDIKSFEEDFEEIEPVKFIKHELRQLFSNYVVDFDKTGMYEDPGIRTEDFDELIDDIIKKI